MKKNVIILIIEAIYNLIVSIIKENEDKEKDLSELEKKMKGDIELADFVRKANPGMSDDKIMKDLC